MPADAGILGPPQPGKGKKQKTAAEASSSASRPKFFEAVSNLEDAAEPLMQAADRGSSYFPDAETEDSVSGEQNPEESGPGDEDAPDEGPGQDPGDGEVDEPEETDSSYLTAVWNSFREEYGLDGLANPSEGSWETTGGPIIRGIFGAVKVVESAHTIGAEWQTLRQGSWWATTRIMLPSSELSGEDAKALAKIVGASESILNTVAKRLLPVGTTFPMTMFGIYVGVTGVRSLLRIWQQKLKRIGDDTGDGEEVGQQTVGGGASATPGEGKDAEGDSPPAVGTPRRTGGPARNEPGAGQASAVRWPTSSGSGGVAQLKRDLDQFRTPLKTVIDNLDQSYRDTLGAKKAFGGLTKGSGLREVKQVGDNLDASVQYLRVVRKSLEASISRLNVIYKKL